MRLLRGTSTASAKSLIAGAGLVLAGGLAVTAGGSAPALGASGGTIEHWGTFGGAGVRGEGDTHLSPVAVTVPGPIAEVGTSNSTEYALLTSGALYAWGVGTRGELGNGGTGNSFTTAVQVKFPAGVKIASIPADAMPYDTAFAIDTSGHAWGWGDNRGGELCLGSEKAYTTPVQLGFSDVTSLAGAANHASYDAGGTVYSCGQNNDGELGDGSTKHTDVPVAVQGLKGQQVTTLVSGFANTGALLSDGRYFDWGWNGQGQLGDGTTGAPSDVPVQVSLPAAVTQVVQGGDAPKDGQTLVMLAGGALYAWGADGAYQLGTGIRKTEPSPVRFFPPSGVTYKFLATGGFTSYAIAAGGDVYAWGGNRYGELGNGTTVSSAKPVVVETGATGISSTSNNVAVSVQG